MKKSILDEDYDNSVCTLCGYVRDYLGSGENVIMGEKTEEEKE